MASEAIRERTRLSPRPSQSRHLTRAAVASLFATRPKERATSQASWSLMVSFLGKFSASLLTEVKGGFVSTAVAFSFCHYPWWNVAYWNQNNNKKHCRTIQNTKTDLTIHTCMFFWLRKRLNHKILRILNVNSFREVFYHTFSHLLLRIISYTLDVLNVLLGYEFRLRFSVRKGFMWNLLHVNVKYQFVILFSFTDI